MYRKAFGDLIERGLPPLNDMIRLFAFEAGSP